MICGKCDESFRKFVKSDRNRRLQPDRKEGVGRDVMMVLIGGRYMRYIVSSCPLETLIVCLMITTLKVSVLLFR